MRFVGLLLLSAVGLFADTHQVMRVTSHGIVVVSTSDSQAGSYRYQREGDDIVNIRNDRQRTNYLLNLKTLEYQEMTPGIDGLLFSLAMAIKKPPVTHESGKTLNVYYGIEDTGESRQLLGRTARHLVIKERRVAEPGACQASFETERDGWYVPFAKTGKKTRTGAMIIGLSGSSLCLSRQGGDAW